MGENISLFSGYNSAENRTTNYCLLVLKTLYEDNPKYLGEVLVELLGGDLDDLVGVNFRQQERKKSSVPDGLITQKAFTIYIEAKNWDWFYDTQLEAHLEALHAESPGVKILIALGNFDNLAADRFDRIEKVCAGKYRNLIAFAHVSFEELLSACEHLAGLSKNLTDMLADYRQYLTGQGLLSSWEQILDVVNCAVGAQEVIEDNFYRCPATGGDYNHSRAKFFGMYRNKKVVSGHGGRDRREGKGWSVKWAMIEWWMKSKADRACWAQVASAVQMRSHQRRPASPRVPWVILRSMARKRI